MQILDIFYAEIGDDFSLEVDFLFCSVGQDLRERFSGAVEAFARRNVSSPGIRSSKEVVSFFVCLFYSRTSFMNCVSDVEKDKFYFLMSVWDQNKCVTMKSIMKIVYFIIQSD